MDNRKVVVDHLKLPTEVKKAMELQYPFGFGDQVFKFTDHKNVTYSAVLVTVQHTTYLVKLNPHRQELESSFLDE
jgi:hypothetical protein